MNQVLHIFGCKSKNQKNVVSECDLRTKTYQSVRIVFVQEKQQQKISQKDHSVQFCCLKNVNLYL